MAKRFDFGGVNLSAGEESSNARVRDDTPFSILILGDFSGRKSRGVCDAQTIANRRPIEIDRDNFDQVLSRLHVELKLPLGESGSIRLQFSELEDFHPDRIFERIGAFETLRSLRSKVADASTFQEAARELGLASRDTIAIQAQEKKVVKAPAHPPSAVQIASGHLLDEMIAETESRVSESPRSSDPVQDFARRLAEQHSQNTPDPRQAQVLAVLDHAVGGLMRAILHNQDFQQLESIWRATSYLVRQLDTGPRLKVYMLDVSKEELAADLNSKSNLRDTGMYSALAESAESPGAVPWATIAGCYAFDEQNENALLLARMAQIAERAGAPFVAQASPRLLGCASLNSASHVRDWRGAPTWWAELRRRPEARYLGLGLPRFLLRLPYGRKTSALESFDFEEFLEEIGHEDYLWGNPAFAVALLLGQSFSESGPEMRPGRLAEILHLPLHIVTHGGESQAKPCAEVLFTEETVAAIIDAGFMPLVSFKNRDSIRVARFQSIAEPASPLAGPWVS